MSYNPIEIAFYSATGLILGQNEDEVDAEAVDMCEETVLGRPAHGLVVDFTEAMLELLKGHILTISELFEEVVHPEKDGTLRHTLLEVIAEFRENTLLSIEGIEDDAECAEEKYEAEGQLEVADHILDNLTVCSDREEIMFLYDRSQAVLKLGA